MHIGYKLGLDRSYPIYNKNLQKLVREIVALIVQYMVVVHLGYISCSISSTFVIFIWLSVQEIFPLIVQYIFFVD